MKIPRLFSAFLANVYLIPDESTGKPRHPIISTGLKAFLDYAIPAKGFAFPELGLWLKKKRLKSGIGGALVNWTAALYPNSEIIISNSSYKSGLGRVFAAAAFDIKHNPIFRGHAETLKDTIRFDNDSFAEVLTSQAKSIAGHSARLTLVDEAWSLDSNNGELKWAELIPAQGTNKCRVSMSYAGILGYSVVLERYWKIALEGINPLKEHPYIWENQEAGLVAAIEGEENFAFWGHPTAQRLAQLKATEQPQNFSRLYLNVWSSGHGIPLLTLEEYEALLEPALKPLGMLNDNRLCVAALDIGVTRASSALVLMRNAGEYVDILRAVEYEPQLTSSGTKREVDLQRIEDDIVAYWDRGQINALVYDPREAAFLIQRLGVRVPKLETIALEQNSSRYRTDAQLVDAIRERKLRIPPGFEDLKKHMLGTSLIVNKNGTRIDRAKGAQKNDLSVAVSMCLDKCLGERPITLAPVRQSLNPFFPDTDWMSGSELIEQPTVMEIQPGPESVLNRQAMAKEKHSSGVTWRNCRLRNKGCGACYAELREGGFYQASDTQLWLTENR